MIVVCPQPCFAVAASPAGCSAGCAADAKAREATNCKDWAVCERPHDLHACAATQKQHASAPAGAGPPQTAGARAAADL